MTALLGGIDSKLPYDWSVEVETHSMMGGVDTRLTEPADVPEGAPRLRIAAKAWPGGVEITSAPG